MTFTEKSSHLLKLAEGSDRLRLFKADLREEGSFDEAVRSCSGLFHVAAPMEFGVQATENVGKYACLIKSLVLESQINWMKEQRSKFASELVEIE